MAKDTTVWDSLDQDVQEILQRIHYNTVGALGNHDENWLGNIYEQRFLTLARGDFSADIRQHNGVERNGELRAGFMYTITHATDTSVNHEGYVWENKQDAVREAWTKLVELAGW